MRTNLPTYSISKCISLVRNEIDSPILVCSKQRDITDVDDRVYLIICFAYLLGFSFVDSKKKINGFCVVLCVVPNQCFYCMHQIQWIYLTLCIFKLELIQHT